MAEEGVVPSQPFSLSRHFLALFGHKNGCEETRGGVEGWESKCGVYPRKAPLVPAYVWPGLKTNPPQLKIIIWSAPVLIGTTILIRPHDSMRQGLRLGPVMIVHTDVVPDDVPDLIAVVQILRIRPAGVVRSGRKRRLAVGSPV